MCYISYQHRPNNNSQYIINSECFSSFQVQILTRFQHVSNGSDFSEWLRNSDKGTFGSWNKNVPWGEHASAPLWARSLYLQHSLFQESVTIYPRSMLAFAVTYLQLQSQQLVQHWQFSPELCTVQCNPCLDTDADQMNVCLLLAQGRSLSPNWKFQISDYFDQHWEAV